MKLFQSTLPRRERPSATGYKGASSAFQSTLPRRERPLIITPVTKYRGISIHAPAKGATGCKCRKRPHDRISIHAPAKGATDSPVISVIDTWNFNPRSREGSDIVQPHLFVSLLRISIHAPAKGATSQSGKPACFLAISIHAPAKGATKLLCMTVVFVEISIHAPAKGATIKIVGMEKLQKFQSTLPRRERLLYVLIHLA